MKNQLEKLNAIHAKIETLNFKIGCTRYGMKQMLYAKDNGLNSNLIERELTDLDKTWMQGYEKEKSDLLKQLELISHAFLKQVQEELHLKEVQKFEQDREDEVNEDSSYQDWQMENYGNIK